jgi:hypothetical protein
MNNGCADSHTALHAMQTMSMNYRCVATSSWNMQTLPFNAKTRSETCTGIKVSYEKCWQILKLRISNVGK